MKLIATTVIRHSVIGSQISGRIIEIDWRSGRILKDFPVPDPKFPMSNTNPRGGLRGGRGLKFWEGNYYVANYDSVYIYNQKWQLQGEISHPLSTDIHEIDIDDEGVWLSCSRYDLVIKLDFASNLIAHWHIHDAQGLCRKLGIISRPLDFSIDYRERGVPDNYDLTHLNCIQIGCSNSIIINLGLVHKSNIPSNLLKQIAKILPTSLGLKSKLKSILAAGKAYIIKVSLSNKNDCNILAESNARRPSHNGMILSDRELILACENQQIVTFNRQTKHVSRSIHVDGNWLRGLARVSDSRVVVGRGPAGIVEVDLVAGEIKQEITLSNNKFESIHGLTFIAG